MKKIIGIFLASILLVGLTGCASTKCERLNPIKAGKDVDRWVQENIW